MPELIIMIGVPGSGKSRKVDKLVKKKSYQVVCRDDVRLSLGTEFEERLEPFVLAIVKTMVRAHMERGLNIIIDETNTHISVVKVWLNLALKYDYDIQYIVMTTDLDVCKQRRCCKEGKFPEDVIDRMYDQMMTLLADLKQYDPNCISITS